MEKKKPLDTTTTGIIKPVDSLIKKDYSQEIQEQDVTADLNVQKVNEAVLEIVKKNKYEIMRCVNCPILLECSYPKRRLDSLRTQAKEKSEAIYGEEIELDNSAENVLRAQNKRDYIYNTYIRDNAYSVLKNDRCIFEREEIINSLQKFVDSGYNVADPRVYLIVKELISNILNSGRANKAFTNLGLILRRETSAGPIYYKNPLIESKIEFSRIIMEATEALDRMLKTDDKEIQAKTFTEHLMKKMKIYEQKKTAVIDAQFTQENTEDKL